MQWDAITVDAWREIYEESRGRRTKVWVQEPETGARWLRKTPIPRAPCEAAIEHTVLQLAAACGLPVARSRPASWTGTSYGIIVETFLASGDNLEPGANVIRGHDPAVVLDDTPAGRAAHTPDLAIESVRARNPALVEPLLAMLLFDAWVGNGDRHSENWAIITRGDASQRLAPMYDVSSCFGSGLLDNHSLLTVPDDAAVETFVMACRSGFGDGRQNIAMANVVERLKRQSEWVPIRDRGLPIFGKLIGSNTVDLYLDGVPDAWLSSPRKRLVRMLLERRFSWLEKHT